MSRCIIMLNNIWKRLSSSQKIGAFGSLLLIISLMLNWFSDKDVFRSGDTYTALSGPLYFVGLSILLLAVFNLGMIILAAMRIKLVTKMSVGTQGKLQMMAGFASMYLLVVINSVYFHPQFGLNILEKKSEIGVMVALAATVMVCVAGYLCYRQKFEQTLPESAPAANETVQDGVVAEQRPASSLSQHEIPVPLTPALQPATVSLATAAPVQAAARSAPAGAIQDTYFSERDPRGKTDYERTKLYENLKKTMIRDTLSPEQRRKLLAKEAKDNAFSANFGKSGPVIANAGSSAGGRKARSLEETIKNPPTEKPVSATRPAEPASADKKPQMYRMDL